ANGVSVSFGWFERIGRDEHLKRGLYATVKRGLTRVLPRIISGNTLHRAIRRLFDEHIFLTQTKTRFDIEAQQRRIPPDDGVFSLLGTMKTRLDRHLFAAVEFHGTP